MSPSALAQMLSTILYGKRFFPYYTFNAVAGIDSDGRGCIFTYDPVGNMERVGWDASGSAGNLIQPFLDNQVSLFELKTEQCALEKGFRRCEMTWASYGRWGTNTNRLIFKAFFH